MQSPFCSFLKIRYCRKYQFSKMPNWCASGTYLYATFALGKLARYEETLRFSASFNDSAEVGGKR